MTMGLHVDLGLRKKSYRDDIHFISYLLIILYAAHGIQNRGNNRTKN